MIEELHHVVGGGGGMRERKLRSLSIEFSGNYVDK